MKHFILLTFLLGGIFCPTFSKNKNTNESIYNGTFCNEPKIDSLLLFATKHKGKPYRRSASGPNAFDCSGFTYYVFKNFGITLNRTSSSQSEHGKKIKRKHLQPGDLVFFNGRSAGGSRIGHVGIVLTKTEDDFTFIHAATSTGVSIDKGSANYYDRRYVTARRIFDNEKTLSTTNLLSENSTETDSVKLETTKTNNTNNSTSWETTKTHKVKKKQTLSSISRKYKCSISDLKKWNNLTSDKLKIGQILIVQIKEQEQKNTNQQIHIVQKGETLYNISRQYNCSVSDLKQWNDLQSNTLNIGQKIKINKD